MTRIHELRDVLATKGFRGLLLDECGAMSINSLTKEAIAVLILIIIYILVPKIGLMISNSMASIGR